jgi:putative PIN family toxin of toxin-antitoxin system
VRLVLDTNIALSGLLWGGVPGQLIDAAERQRVELASSTALLAELQGVLSRPKFAAQFAKRGLTTADVFDGYAALVVNVSPLSTPRVVERDPDDNHVIACAVAAKADAIVSGDRHLLDLRQHQGIAILTAAEAIKRIA